MGDWKLLRQVVIYMVYLATRFFFSLGTTFCRLLNGTYNRIQQRHRPENYAWCAHVQNIVYRHKFDLIIEPAGARNFFLTHNRFDHPDVILRDNVTLYNITDTEAIFVETDEDVDVTLMETCGFVTIAQFYRAQRVIEIPIESFNRLARQVGDPQGDVVLINNTSRCGSTLLTQFFEETGQCLCYSEPDAIVQIGFLVGKVPDTVLEERLLSCIRLLFKPRANKTYRANVIKNKCLSINVTPLFAKVYPKAGHIFNYRDGASVVRSLMRMADGFMMWKVMIISANVNKSLAKWVYSLCPIIFEEPEWFEPGSIAFKCALTWAVCCRSYINLSKMDVPIAGIRYEDFLADPLKAGRSMLKFLHLPEELAEKGIGALNKDSQRNSPISRDAVGRVPVPELTTGDLARIDEICRRYNLPSIAEKCVLENTISG